MFYFISYGIFLGAGLEYFDEIPVAADNFQSA